MTSRPEMSISFLAPTNLTAYKRGIPATEQTSIPIIFHDAMIVRNDVFVVEQRVPAENEFDSDDSRSCHFVAYDSIKRTDGSVTPKVPVGTIRIVPFPHAPHPTPGKSYWDGVPEGEEPNTSNSSRFTYVDRATDLHNGREPYVKFGRLAVQKNYRGKGVAGQLTRAALEWLAQNPTAFDAALPPANEGDEGQLKFKGLVCAHAQVQAKASWARWGFVVDEGMGTWNEEGISHVGMFQRVPIAE
ncbi:hypothetical protein BROUX41_005055 [Berkeleyomyces rouxiae]|uniref:uncharacterized protein n=1 Tax=Berkeleyomyces rouxiae TaxID=2035830 RepID=UPI003B7BC0F7